MVRIPTRVLLVDDEKDFVEMLSLRLQEAGEKVSAAYSGKRMSRYFKKKPTSMWLSWISRCPAWMAWKHWER